MKPPRLLSFSLLLLIWISSSPPGAVSASPLTSAIAACLMDADTGEILYEKNAHLPLPMASTTKVMTGLLGVERLRPHELVHVSSYAALMEPSKIYLRPGELIRVDDLLLAILLKSANDASAALAEKISGSETAFARVMTRRAQELGAHNTHFENASGLPAEGHYSTAYDLAIILRYAMQRPDFADFMQMRTAMISSANGRMWSIRNHNRLLWTFPGALGGKTGWTRASKHCYVGMAERGSRTLLVSILGSTRMWDDVQSLLTYGFSGNDSVDTRVVLGSPSDLSASLSPSLPSLPPPISSRALSAPPPRQPAPKSPVIRGLAEASVANTAGYTVQVGAFRQKSSAELLREKLRKHGYNARIATSGPRTARWYRVRVGDFDSPGEAKQVIGRLKKQMGLQGQVASSD
jgi:D-alanyl-D-alanine carboxypeptidase (penicillin-binding protein 5/6)